MEEGRHEKKCPKDKQANNARNGDAKRLEKGQREFDVADKEQSILEFDMIFTSPRTPWTANIPRWPELKVGMRHSDRR